MKSIGTGYSEPILSPWSRIFLPSIADSVFLLLFIMCLISGNRMLQDSDTAWHIRTGDYIVAKMEVPKTDIFSYRKYGQPWIAHEWLSEVIFALFHRFAGLNGVVAVSALLIASTFFLLFKFLKIFTSNILVVASVTVLTAVTTSVHWLARPHLFSMCLTLVWCVLLESHRRYPQKKHLVLFPLFMCLWVNLHGGYIVGFVLLAIYGLGGIIDYFAATAPRLRANKSRVVSIVAIGFLSALAALLNPYGYRLLLFPFEVLGSSTAMDAITEWQSPSFHHFSFYEFQLLLLIVLLLLSAKKIDFIECAVTLFAVHISLVGQRYIPIFAILTAPILGSRLNVLSQAFVDGSPRLSALRRLQSKMVEAVKRLQFLEAHLNRHVLLLALGLVTLFLLRNNGRVFGKTIIDCSFQGSKYPLQAARFVADNAISGNMYNSYGFGGYLIYKFFPDPRYRVFVDSRAIVGGQDYFTEYLEVEQLTPNWSNILQKYRVNWIIQETNSVLALFLAGREDWKIVYSDHLASVFVRNAPENRRIIEREPAVKLQLLNY